MALPSPQPLDYAAPYKRDPGQRNWWLVALGLATMFLPGTCLFFGLNGLFIVPVLVGLGCAIAGGLRMQRTARERVARAGIILCAVAAVGPSALSAWSNREGRPVEIVLPVGYRGEFSIVKDHAKGQDLVVRDGQWVFKIPAGGVLVVKQTYPFNMWHTETIIDADGDLVGVQDLGEEAGSISTGPNSSRGSTDYDGTTFRWKTTDPP